METPTLTESRNRTIAQIVPMPHHAFDAHTGAYMLRAQADLISPFIGIDSFSMPQPFFGPHPHAGMSAVTLLLPESEGGVTNRDSLGDHSLIRPGDLHWTQAGRGMMHEEIPSEPGRAAVGLQVFVNLARVHKRAEPAVFRIDHESMPTVSVPGGEVRVVAGTFDGQASPITTCEHWLTRVNMLDITLQPHARLSIPVAPGDNAFFAWVSGSLVIDGRIVNEAVAVLSARDGDRFTVHAGPRALRGVVFSGTPIDEPIVAGGPFLGNDAGDIMAYRRAFARGEMGSLTPSF